MDFPRVTCADVDLLASFCSISQEKAITSLTQCSSSLFVLLYQRLFNCTIKGIDVYPYTLEQKKWNVLCVLNELKERRGIDVSGIDAEEIVRLNEDHISRLILLFMNIAFRMDPQGGPAAPLALHPAGAGAAGDGAATRPVLAEIPHESAPGGAWYVPVAADPAKAADETAHGPFPHAHSHALAHEQPSVLLPLPEDEAAAVGEEDEGASDGSYGNAEEEDDRGAIPTTQLVAAWNAEVIPPGRNSRMVESEEIADVRERLSMLDEVVAHNARERMKRRKQRELQAHRADAVRRGGGKRVESWEASQMMPMPQNLVPDTFSTDEHLRSRPKRIIDYTLRDDKIEMLRSMRFMDDMQKDIRRQMVMQHNKATRQMRAEVRQALEDDRREKFARKRLIKEEDQKYRNAYSAIVEGACNDLRRAKDVMLGRTRELALCQRNSLRESHRMCRYMKRESNERMRHDLLRYASTVTGWQSQFAG